MSLAAEVEALLGCRVADARPVAGGDLNDAYAVTLADGRRVFVKTHDAPPAGGYAAEAAGLAWLAEAAVRVPEVLGVSERMLVLGWIEAGRLEAAGEEALGRGLAALHAGGAPAFGSVAPGAPSGVRLGPLLLSGEPGEDWPAFYARARLAPLARMAAERGALPAGAEAAVDAVCARIGELAGPAEPPARLHGDLWGGNVLATAGGEPVLIDPAAYGGHREVDLAMLRLFGGPSERCFAAYAEAAPLADGHGDRVALWQIFPLLVHAVLFGGDYGARAGRAAARYG